nr:formin-like protein 5 [Microcebus murinus]
MTVPSCFAPAKFLKLYSKRVWEPSSSLIHPVQLRSNQPPSWNSPLSQGLHPGRSRSLSSRLKLPADPPRALPGSPEPPPPPPPRRSPRAESPGPGSTDAPAKYSPLAVLPSRPGRPQAGEAQAGQPGWRKDAPCGRRPVLAAHTPPVRRARPPPPWPSPGRWADAWVPRRARPPPGRLLPSPPHPDPPAAPFLTGGRAGLAGRREPARVGGLPRARARDLSRRVLGLPASWAPNARAAKARSNESSSPPPSRARSRSRRLSAPGSRHDAKRASERNRLRRSRRRHRGRRRLRLPRDVPP